MRGLDYPDSAVCACIGLANRLFEEFGCSQLHTLVLDAAHTFVVRDRPNVKMDEAFLGLLLCPADGDSLDLYRDILGICGQTRRVVTWAGFVFEFAGKFDITNSKRLRYGHLVLESWSLRVTPIKSECSSADMISVLTSVGGADVDFIFPKLSKRLSSERPGSVVRSLSWVAGISAYIPSNSLRNPLERLCSLSLQRDNFLQPGTSAPTVEAAVSDSFLHLDRNMIPTSRDLAPVVKKPAVKAASKAAPPKSSSAPPAPANPPKAAATATTKAPEPRKDHRGVEYSQVALVDWRSHGSSPRSKREDIVSLKARIAFLEGQKSTGRPSPLRVVLSDLLRRQHGHCSLSGPFHSLSQLIVIP